MPKKLERCVKAVQKTSKSESLSFAICHKTIKKTSGRKRKRK